MPSIARRSGPNRQWPRSWTASAPARWSTPTKPAGVRAGPTATCGLSAPPPNATFCERYFLRRGRGKTVVDVALSDAFSGVLVSDCYAAYHHYDGPSSGAGRTPVQARGRLCCGTSTTSEPSTPMLRHWPGGPTPSTGFTTGPKPALIPRPSGGAPPNWPWSGSCWPSANPSGTTRRQPRPSCADASSATSRACPVLDTGTPRLRGRTRSAFREQQRRRTQPVPSGYQPQGQRRHPLGAGHREQDDAGIHLRHLARPRSKSSRRLPSVARFPSTLNCYVHEHPHNLWRRAVALRHIQRGQA